jgi:hypothetical protein
VLRREHDRTMLAALARLRPDALTNERLQPDCSPRHWDSTAKLVNIAGRPDHSSLGLISCAHQRPGSGREEVAGALVAADRRHLRFEATVGLTVSLAARIDAPNFDGVTTRSAG